MNLFEAKNASKRIDGTLVLNDITIKISKGERVAIIGSNGSGKSSLLKLVGGIYEETNGDVQRQKVEIGFVPEHFPENIRFNIRDYLSLIGKMNGQNDTYKNIEYYSQSFEISEFLNTPLRKCSKGTKQKVGIIQALLKEPDLLLLDEPLTGLDDQAQYEFLNQIHSLPKEVTILFTVHEQLLIDRLAERVITVEGGKIISDSLIGREENVRIIKARIPSKDIVLQVPSLSHHFIGDNTVEFIVRVNDSDRVLSMLLARECSIMELKEKR